MRQMFTFASLFLCPEEEAPCGGGDSRSKCGSCWIRVKSIALDWNRTPNRPAHSIVAMWTTLTDYMDSPSGPRPPQWIFLITMKHISFGGIPLDEWSARRRDLYLETHSTHKRETSMSLAGFEPTIATSERPNLITRASWDQLTCTIRK
jgi:hypothetical protein